MAAYWGGWGNCCCNNGTSICVTVTCDTTNYPAAGALVQIFTGSTLVDQCTTSSNGCCILNDTGTYTLKISIGGTILFSGSKTLNGTLISVNVNVTSAGYECCPSPVGPVPATIYMTYAGVMFPLTWDGLGWLINGAFIPTTGGIQDLTTGDCNSNGNAYCNFTVSCPDASGNYQIVMQWATVGGCSSHGFLFAIAQFGSGSFCQLNGTDPYSVLAAGSYAGGVVSFSGTFPATIGPDDLSNCYANAGPLTVPGNGGTFTGSS